MRRALLAAGAALIIAGPAFAADEVVIEKKTTTTTTKEVTSEPPASGSTVSTVVIAPNPPPEPRVEARPAPPGPSVVWMGGHWHWAPVEKISCGCRASTPSRRGRTLRGSRAAGCIGRTAGSSKTAAGTEADRFAAEVARG